MKMYLSRVEVNKQRIETKRALMNLQIMHAAVKSCFPQMGERTLWRLDALGHALYVLVVSPIKPDFTSFIQQFGWPASEQMGESRDYEQLLNRIESGSRWGFRLVANPVHMVKGKIYAHVTVAQQRKWLTDRAERNGFILRDTAFDVVQREKIQFSKGDSPDRHKVTISQATFEGALEVSDVELFKRALVNGIGRAKAYGCGLLTIAKLP
jgi:CRISPR system Cascade subunit CasE